MACFIACVPEHAGFPRLLRLLEREGCDAVRRVPIPPRRDGPCNLLPETVFQSAWSLARWVYPYTVRLHRGVAEPIGVMHVFLHLARQMREIDRVAHFSITSLSAMLLSFTPTLGIQVAGRSHRATLLVRRSAGCVENTGVRHSNLCDFATTLPPLSRANFPFSSRTNPPRWSDTRPPPLKRWRSASSPSYTSWGPRPPPVSPRQQ